MKKRSHMLLTAIPTIIAIVATAAPAIAAPAQGYEFMEVHALSDPSIFDRNGNIAVDWRNEKSFERFAGATKQATEAHPMSHKQAEDLAIQQGAAHGTPAASMTGDMSTAIEDDITPEECRENSNLSSRPQGWVKNHYSYCKLNTLVAAHLICYGPGRVLCRVGGYFVARATTIGYAYNGLRNVEFRAILDQISIGKSGNSFFITYEVGCASDPSDSCLPGMEQESKRAGQWRSDGDVELYFHSPSELPDPAYGEQIATGVFRAKFRASMPSGQTDEDGIWETSVRFDSAWYLSPKQGSIFDRSIPWIGISKTNEDEDESANHIDKALRDPNSTVPSIRPQEKHIPGGSIDDPLHRLIDPVRKDRNREGNAKPVCRAVWPNYSQLGKDCDEFPFASTYEGAGRHEYEDVPYGMFSVEAIDKDDNQQVGNRLGVWYNFDRILDKDRFFVRILN